MAKVNHLVSEFNFQGKLSKLSWRKNQIKYIKLVTDEGKYWLKIPQNLREKIASLSPGCQLEVAGKSKQHPTTGKTKYKAQTVVLVARDQAVVKTQSSRLPVFDSKTKSKAKVLVCQKSNCWKKGGKRVCAELESILSDRGLTNQIPIQKTGCLKQCKKAPALVMMPDKARYNQVKPQQVEKMVEKHLIADS